MIELLVVIAIIAILVALLLPAVQQVREAARKSQCQDHLHNLVIAIHSYEGVSKVLPPRQTGTGTNNGGGMPQRTAMSGFYSLMPFVEQKPLYDTIAAANVQPWDNNPVNKHNIELFMCPSDSIGPDPQDANRTRGLHNYVFCGGDSLLRSRLADSSNVANSVVRVRGSFGALWCYSMADIQDGTSNTIFMSETVRASASNGWGAVSGSAQSTPAACNALLNKQQMTIASPLTTEYYRGYRYLTGMAHDVGFNTAVPPNGASCQSTASTIGWGPGFYSAGSRHPGGCQVVMGDAKVSFVSENIDAGNQSDTPPGETAGGNSPYGVWGALGTRASGETASLR